MRVYFLRHGPADAAMWAGPGPERPLTEDGRRVVGEVAERLARLGVSFDAILTSPYARAAQTAEIVAHALGIPERLRPDTRLESGFDTAALREILAEHRDDEVLLLVGHEPDFSEVVGELIGGGDVKLKKAGLALVDVLDADVPRGRLLTLAQPRWMRP